MTWLEQARTRSVVMRATRTSILVGAILVAINQGDLILTEGWAALSLPKLLLTFFVPYAVSTSSSVASNMQHHRTSGGGRA